MIIETLLLAFIIGKIRGGRLRNMGLLEIRGWYIFLISFLIEVLSILIGINNWGNLGYLVENNLFIIHSLVYLLIFIGFVINLDKKGIIFVLIGTILNCLPIILNHGKMPVSVAGLKNSFLYEQLNLLKGEKILTHTLINKETKLSILSDIIPIPKPYPFPKVISIGDIVIAVGIFILVQEAMKLKRKDINMINFLM